MFIFIVNLFLALFSIESNSVIITVYNATKQQCDDTPFITASGFNINHNDQYHHRILALSRDLEHNYNLEFGDSVYVTGTPYDGWWYFEDRMHHRWTNKVDLLINQNMPIGKWHGTILITN
jgi:3D (Asp-Asp-Asp) domain-containing protein